MRNIVLIPERFLEGLDREKFRLEEARVDDFYHQQRLYQDNWENVIDHCITVGKRVAVLCNILGLSPAQRLNGLVAALLHDACKRQEIEYTEKHGKTWETFDAAYSKTTALLAEHFTLTVVNFATSVAHDSLLDRNNREGIQSTVNKLENRLDHEQLVVEECENDLVALAIHYIDDFTKGSSAVGEAAYEEGRGWINDLDRRMDSNESNANYQLINKGGRSHFFGQTSYAAQRYVGKRVEALLARLVAQQLGREVDPTDLPSLIHARVRELEKTPATA